MTRSTRNFLRIAGTALFAGLAWSIAIEPDMLVVRQQTVTADWPETLSGLRIAILSDLHVGSPHIDLAKLQEVVDKTNAQKPDLIVLLGDYVVHGVLGGHFVEPEPIAAVLKNLGAPMGVYAVLGNHDWWYDGPRVMSAFQDVGIPVLENRSIKLGRGEQTFWIAGIADYWTRPADIDKAIEGIPEQDPVIALTHNPDIFPEIPSRIQLTLAGHTHGGQVALPLIGRPIVPSKYGQKFGYGNVWDDDNQLFVTGGIGTSILPIRFRVPPEIVILTLESPGS